MSERHGPFGPLYATIVVAQEPRPHWWSLPRPLDVTMEWHGDQPGSETIQVTERSQAATLVEAAREVLQRGQVPNLADTYTMIFTPA